MSPVMRAQYEFIKHHQRLWESGLAWDVGCGDTGRAGPDRGQPRSPQPPSYLGEIATLLRQLEWQHATVPDRAGPLKIKCLQPLHEVHQRVVDFARDRTDEGVAAQANIARRLADIVEVLRTNELISAYTIRADGGLRGD